MVYMNIIRCSVILFVFLKLFPFTTSSHNIIYFPIAIKKNGSEQYWLVPLKLVKVIFLNPIGLAACSQLFCDPTIV